MLQCRLGPGPYACTLSTLPSDPSAKVLTTGTRWCSQSPVKAQFSPSLYERGWQSLPFSADAGKVIQVQEDTGTRVPLGMVERTGDT